jgi:uncharacterized membrane protein
MESKIKVLGHPLHPLVVPLPLGVLGMAVIFDVLGVLLKRPALNKAAHPMIAAGVVSGLQAGGVGAVDWLALPDGTRAKQVATQHGLGNVGILLLFGLVWWRRRKRPADVPAPVLGLELLGLGGATVTGWLGGELVNRLGVGVHKGAHLDAPSSLSGLAADDVPRRTAG